MIRYTFIFDMFSFCGPVLWRYSGFKIGVSFWFSCNCSCSLGAQLLAIYSTSNVAFASHDQTRNVQMEKFSSVAGKFVWIHQNSIWNNLTIQNNLIKWQIPMCRFKDHTSRMWAVLVLVRKVYCLQQILRLHYSRSPWARFISTNVLLPSGTGWIIIMASILVSSVVRCYVWKTDEGLSGKKDLVLLIVNMNWWSFIVKKCVFLFKNVSTSTIHQSIYLTNFAPRHIASDVHFDERRAIVTHHHFGEVRFWLPFSDAMKTRSRRTNASFLLDQWSHAEYPFLFLYLQLKLPINSLFSGRSAECLELFR